MGDFPKHDFRPKLLTGVSYEGNFNAAELHFECYFQGYPTLFRTPELMNYLMIVGGVCEELSECKSQSKMGIHPLYLFWSWLTTT